MRLCRRGKPRFQFYRFDDDFWQRKVVAICRQLTDGIEDFEPFYDLAEDGVFSVQFREGSQAGVKLASVGIFCEVDVIRKAGHGDRAIDMGKFDFGGHSVTGAAGSCAVCLAVAARGITCLHKRSREDPVKTEAIVKFPADQVFKVGNGDRRSFVIEGDGNPLGLLLFTKPDLDDGDFWAERCGVGCLLADQTHQKKD